LDESGGVGDGTENSTLHLDHFQGRRMVAWIGSGGAIRENKAFVPTIICFSHGRMDANVCGDAAEDDVPDASSLKEHIEIGPIERTFARLIDNAFSGWRSNVGNDLPAGFGTGQNFARRARDHDAGSDAPAAPLLVSRKIRKIRSMTFARMKNLERLCACRLKNALDRPDGRLGKGRS
jgi:hypothetical protein